MPSFHNGAVEIAYLDEGDGDPIVLVHGFASSKDVNWVYPTWVSLLRQDGRTVAAIGFGLGHLPVQIGERVDAVFTPRLSRWQGVERLELEVVDVRAAGSGDGPEGIEIPMDSLIP